MQGGSRLVAASLAADARGWVAHMPDGPSDAIQIQRNPADTATFAQPSSILREAISKEAFQDTQFTHRKEILTQCLFNDRAFRSHDSLALGKSFLVFTWVLH